MTTTIPTPTPPYEGVIQRLIDDSTAVPLDLPDPPSGPNIVLVLLDDVGFGSCSTFGGPVPTPAVDKVARAGLRYNQFHTTALCAPTRAALLTGRNHHSVHMGGITETSNSFPGYDTVIPRESALIAEVLRQNGYSTGCFGKWHLTPMWEFNPAGPFDRWPTGQGFDRFYGIIGAEASMYEPAVYDQTRPVAPYVGHDDYHFTEDLADQAIHWIRQQKAAAPDRPFFCYFSTPAVHAPHHVAPEWIEPFAGRFDAGWDALREEIFERQLDLGVIPPGTTLTPRPDEVPCWDEYPDRYKPVARRLMEVFAGFLAHTDAQVGRVLEAVDDLGVGDDTLVIYLTGDNGASAEGTIHGAWSAPSFQNGVHEDPEWLLEHIDDFGTARCENHFNVGWAWALDSPFQWMKQVASHFGGTRNGLAISWPNGIDDAGGLRHQFHHVVDLAPTILAAAGIEAPQVVNGIEQMPVNGVPMNYTFAAPEAESRRDTQYFEILGNRAIYHDGWMASCFHGRVPWIRLQGYDFDGAQERWELYNIAEDFSQSVDLAHQHPEKLSELRDLFDREARENGVYPLRDAGSSRGGGRRTPLSLGARRRMTYTPDHVRMPERSVVNLKNSSHEITADLVVPGRGARGVVACQGGNMSGWSMYLDDGVGVFLYNCFGQYLTEVRGSESLPPGFHQLRLFYEHDGGLGAGGVMSWLIDGVEVDSARLDRTVPIVFSMSGETFDVGVDTGAPVGPYDHGFPCTAEILGVTLERLEDPDPDVRRAMAEGEFRAALASQ
ncbi:MAG: arylsulfatase [Actinomycetia bacterium]|nr:arylsulfatase [Actinomycetes bacterium]